uniref:Uncharacterized protein n=1 Tax=Sipha flava TaxID=143950 RepID=A0A2S2Q2T0_9HEMI
MGITKKPASICSDEILPIEVDEPLEIETTIFVHDDFDADEFLQGEVEINYSPENESSEFSDLSSEPGNEPIYISNNEPDSSLSSVPNSSLYPELRYSMESNHNNINVDTKPLTFKKKNVSQMGRRKANRAQNDHFLLSLSNDQQQHPEDEIFYNDNKNGFTKVIKKLCIQPDLKDSFIEGNDEIILQKSNKRSAAEMKNNKKIKTKRSS